MSAIFRYLETIVLKHHKLGTRAKDIYYNFALLALGDWEKRGLGAL